MENKNWFKKKEDTESKKEKTLKEKIGSHFTDILIFSPAVIIFALFFMGALGNYANIPNEDFLVNATANINTGTLGTWNYTIEFKDWQNNNGTSDEVIIRISPLPIPPYPIVEVVLTMIVIFGAAGGIVGFAFLKGRKVS